MSKTNFRLRGSNAPWWESSLVCFPCNAGSRRPVLPLYTLAYQWNVTGRGTTLLVLFLERVRQSS